MSHSEAQSQKSSAWFFIGVLLLVVAGALAVKILLALNASEPSEDAARIEERIAARVALEASNKERLESYAWVDRQAGSVQIPIGVAMELTVASLQGTEPTPAGPVDPAAVAPVESPADPVSEPAADPVEAADTSAVGAPASPGSEAATETPAPEPATSPATP